MDVGYVKNLLKNIGKELIITSDKVKLKIEITHGLKFDDIANQLLNPKALEAVEEQPSRTDNERTFRLIFKKSSQKRLCIVITEKPDGTIFVVTAFESSKKLDKLVRTRWNKRR